MERASLPGGPAGDRMQRTGRAHFTHRATDCTLHWLKDKRQNAEGKKGRLECINRAVIKENRNVTVSSRCHHQFKLPPHSAVSHRRCFLTVRLHPVNEPPTSPKWQNFIYFFLFLCAKTHLKIRGNLRRLRRPLQHQPLSQANLLWNLLSLFHHHKTKTSWSQFASLDENGNKRFILPFFFCWCCCCWSLKPCFKFHVAFQRPGSSQKSTRTQWHNRVEKRERSWFPENTFIGDGHQENIISRGTEQHFGEIILNK